MSNKIKALIVDDEKNILNTICICLESIGVKTIPCNKPQEAVQIISKENFEIAFVDLKMSPMDGIEVLKEIKKFSPNTTVIIMTAHGSVESAVTAIQNGAYDYLQKPFDYEELKIFTQKVINHHNLIKEVAELKKEIKALLYGEDFITRNRLMLEQLELASQVAESSISVLIEGESGTGKELAAHFIHKKSNRADKPFIKVNCAAIPEQLLESELFGHVRGAFTGALKDRDGRFKMADGGTIFLDEIGELSANIQSKLLRVLQTKDFERVGDNITQKVDVRIISATNKNLDKAIKEGAFREDLFYRLNGVRIKLFPLRERPEDIPILVQHFLNKYSNGKVFEISEDAYKALNSYKWSGNVRELENVIQRATLLAKKNIISIESLPEELRTPPDQSHLSLNEIEKIHIKKVLQIAPDYDKAAKILGIDRKTLLNKRKKYGL